MMFFRFYSEEKSTTTVPMNIAVSMFKAFEGCIEIISLTLVHAQGKGEIEAKRDLPQKCEFYDVRNLVHSVTSEPFVV